MRDLNTQFISACLLEEQNADTKVVEHGADGEDRELRAMLDEADTTAYVDAVLSGHGVTGREAELQQHYKIKANDLPAALLIEQRAVSVATPADVSATQAAPVATPFPTATAEAMGVGRLQVPVGESLFPVVSAPSAGPDDVDEAGTVADTTATITATALKPRRVQVSFTFSREDATTFRGLDAILRERLRNSIADGLDRFALRKTDTGILDHGTDPTAATWRRDVRAVHLDGLRAGGRPLGDGARLAATPDRDRDATEHGHCLPRKRLHGKRMGPPDDGARLRDGIGERAGPGERHPASGIQARQPPQRGSTDLAGGVADRR